MKITDIRVVSRGFPRDFPLVEVDTDAGITGIGATASWTRPVSALLESAPELPGPEPPFRGRLLGADPTRPAELWGRLFDGGWFGRGDRGRHRRQRPGGGRHRPLGHRRQGGRAARSTASSATSSRNGILVYASSSAFPHDWDPARPPGGGPRRR